MTKIEELFNTIIFPIEFYVKGRCGLYSIALVYKFFDIKYNPKKVMEFLNYTYPEGGISGFKFSMLLQNNFIVNIYYEQKALDYLENNYNPEYIYVFNTFEHLDVYSGISTEETLDCYMWRDLKKKHVYIMYEIKSIKCNS